MKTLYQLIHEIPESNDSSYSSAIQKVLDLYNWNCGMDEYILDGIQPQIIEYEDNIADYYISGHKTYQIGKCIIKISFNGDPANPNYEIWNETPDDTVKKLLAENPDIVIKHKARITTDEMIDLIYNINFLGQKENRSKKKSKKKIRKWVRNFMDDMEFLEYL